MGKFPYLGNYAGIGIPPTFFLGHQKVCNFQEKSGFALRSCHMMYHFNAGDMFTSTIVVFEFFSH